MNPFTNHKRYRRRRRRKNMLPAVLLAGGLLCAALAGTGIFLITGGIFAPTAPAPDTSVSAASEESSEAELPSSESPDDSQKAYAAPFQPLLDQAQALAVGYDYDGAIRLLQSDPQYAEESAVQEAIAAWEECKSQLVEIRPSQVTHVFFHSLIVDPSKAFDGESDQDGYNQVMTTVDEFSKMLQILYDKGYVLVRLHDLAYETTDENGKPVMKASPVLLPEGKIPFVMSQDDLCYYPYMDGDGFANRIVIGEDGYPTCEMKQEDGSVVTGSFDLVPLLEDFIQEHPDFSYRGARAVLAFTGYEGILGYRTASSYADSPSYEEDRKAAAAVAQCLREHGWELASHSWGHLNLGTVEWNRFQTDTDKWEAEVESLIGPTDILLFPYGADIGDWRPYTMENDRFRYLHSVGFRYFCNVDSNPLWVQVGDDYMRQGRRNLDGYRMWKDISAEDSSQRRLDDLFRSEDVFDPTRPTPVPDM